MNKNLKNKVVGMCADIVVALKWPGADMVTLSNPGSLVWMPML